MNPQLKKFLAELAKAAALGAAIILTWILCATI